MTEQCQGAKEKPWIARQEEETMFFNATQKKLGPKESIVFGENFLRIRGFHDVVVLGFNVEDTRG